MSQQLTTQPQSGSITAGVLLELLRAISANKSKIKVKETVMAENATFSVFTSHKDYGRVIGTQAGNYACFELFTKLMSAREDREAHLSVVPPENSTAPADARFSPNPSWGKDQLQPLIKGLCEAVFESGGVINVVVPDPMTINVEIKVNNADPLEIIHDGRRITKTLWPKDGRPGEKEVVDIDIALMQKAFRRLFHAIGKNNGRNVNTFVSGVTYPNATR